MSQIWMDGFDHYGGIIANMFNGTWAADIGTGASNSLSTEFARTGAHSLRIETSLGGSTNATIGIRRVLDADYSELFVSFGVNMPELPDQAGQHGPLQFRSSVNGLIASLSINPNGGAVFTSGDIDGTVLGTTAGPVFVAGTWHHVECRIVRDAAAGIFELRVDGTVVLSLTGLALGAVDIGQLACVGRVVSNDAAIYYVDDLIVRNTSGAFNTGFEGDLRVATLQPLQNSANQGWAARSIEKLGIGVMNFQDSAGGIERNEGIIYADNAVFEIAAQDFCVETFVRFNSAITGSENETILSKYQETNDQRSWRLWHDGPDNSSNLHFSVSNLGTLASVTDIQTFPFVPILNRWYHIAVCREGTLSRMFVDGIQVDVDQTDNVTYFSGVSPVTVNGLFELGDNDIGDETGVDGWMDGTRITVGSARYTANFDVPTDVLVDDANTELLLNYDDVGNTDDSTNAFVGTLSNGCFVEFPDDGLAFQTIDGLTPRDANFVEASFVAAVGTLAFPANPLDTETVVLGATTYTFQTVLVDAANNVLIGVDAEKSLANLKAAVNLEAGEGSLYGTGTVTNATAFLSTSTSSTSIASAITPGLAGNSIVSTTTVTSASWSAATLLGGLDIPTNSEFDLSALPSEVTGVRALAIVGRNFKTDAGSSQMQMSFVTVGDDVAAGADNVMTLDPTYYEDTIEQDPTTSGAMTPATINGSRIRLNRTV